MVLFGPGLLNQEAGGTLWSWDLVFIREWWVESSAESIQDRNRTPGPESLLWTVGAVGMLLQIRRGVDKE